MRRKLLLKTLLLLFALIAGSSSTWAEDGSYVITFENSSNSATAIATTTGANTTIAEASRSFVLAKPYSDITGNCYYGGTTDAEKASIRLGKSGNDASLTISLSDEGKVTATSIVLNCMKMSGSKNSEATIQANGMTAQSAPAEAGNLTFTFDNATDIESIVLTSVKAVFIYSITVNYTTGGGGTPTCATPGFSPAEGVFDKAQSVEIACKTEGATIYYTTDGTDPTPSSTVYSAAISVTKTTTIKAFAEKAGYNKSDVATATYKIVTIEHAGTEADPYTVEDARNAIDLNKGTSGVYAKGIISEIVTAYNSTYENITFNFSTDGETKSDQLQAYRCKGIDGVTDVSALQVGDEVLIKGDLKKYGTTYEFADGCVLQPETDTRADAELAWSAASATVTYGADDNIFPTLTNPHSVAVTYSSSNKSAATIDESGKITINDFAGTTTISAIFAGDATYKPQTVTYELTVNKAPFSVKDGIFDFVEAAKAGKDYGSGVSPTSTSSEYIEEDKIWTAGSVVMVTSGKYRWWENGGTLRFYSKKVSEEETTKLTLSVPAKKIITKVVFSGGNSFTPSTGTLTSGTWTGGANSVTFTYSKASGSNDVKSITVTYTDESYAITPAKTYTTLTCAYPLDFSEVTGLTAYIVKDDDASDGKITMTEVSKVPAETGLVLKAETTGSAIDVPILTGDADDVKGNLMTGSSSKMTAIAANGGYILSDGKFHPAKEGKLPEGKAYLKLAVSASELLLDFEGGTTGVNEVRGQKSEVRGDFYDLQGRKVANPTKGLYIVNGKKFVIK